MHALPSFLGGHSWPLLGCRTDVKNDKLSFDVGDDHVEFNLFKASKFLQFLMNVI